MNKRYNQSWRASVSLHSMHSDVIAPEMAELNKSNDEVTADELWYEDSDRNPFGQAPQFALRVPLILIRPQ